MIYPFLALLLVPLVALIVIGYQRPKSLDVPSFAFTRKCLGVAIFTYATSVVAPQFARMDERVLVLAVVAQVIAWIFLIFTIRGVFEILAGK